MNISAAKWKWKRRSIFIIVSWLLFHFNYHQLASAFIKMSSYYFTGCLLIIRIIFMLTISCAGEPTYLEISTFMFTIGSRSPRRARHNNRISSRWCSSRGLGSSRNPSPPEVVCLVFVLLSVWSRTDRDSCQSVLRAQYYNFFALSWLRGHNKFSVSNYLRNKDIKQIRNIK